MTLLEKKWRGVGAVRGVGVGGGRRGEIKFLTDSLTCYIRETFE